MHTKQSIANFRIEFICLELFYRYVSKLPLMNTDCPWHVLSGLCLTLFHTSLAIIPWWESNRIYLSYIALEKKKREDCSRKVVGSCAGSIRTTCRRYFGVSLTWCWKCDDRRAPRELVYCMIWPRYRRSTSFHLCDVWQNALTRDVNRWV